MKNYLTYLIIFVSCLLSCDDFLDQQPGNEVSIDEQLSSKTGLEQAMAGVYSEVEEMVSGRWVVYADVQGGNLTFTPETDNLVGVPFAIENSYDFSDTEQNSDYEGYYEGWYNVINQVNVILERAGGASFLSNFEQEQLRAELLTIRAFAHYFLTLHYAQNYHFTGDASHPGVVYNTQTLIPGADFPARLSLFETYQKLKADLNEALPLFTDNTFLSSEPAYAYFNKTSCQALYARMALQMNDLDQANFYANEVITNSGIVLTSTGSYVEEWEMDREPVSEAILEFSAPRNSDGTVSSSIAEFFRFIDDGNFADYVASGDLLGLYTADDIRSNMFIEEMLITSVNQVEIAVPYYFTKKFQGNAGTTAIRLSEMYLIRAEANARLLNRVEALSDLNTLRIRSGLSELTDTSDVLEEIFLERRRELAFEGHLLFDILRLKKDVIRDQGCISAICNLSYPSNFFILPIPFSSTGLNENIQQNEGY